MRSAEEEVVLTSRRASVLGGGAWSPGRLRISDRLVRFTSHDGAVVEVALTDVSAVRLARLPRRALVLTTPAGPLRLRCFAMSAVAALLRS
ncbi:hypothetical protein [uncultured Amnibacterium sp.]|uniref:hypothetical protein n=1 Tax=uncultured Amnibacterium sp. TaxID=1631851 RepID=UPI0035C96BA2